jgi:hypothetical protein
MITEIRRLWKVNSYICSQRAPVYPLLHYPIKYIWNFKGNLQRTLTETVDLSII